MRAPTRGERAATTRRLAALAAALVGGYLLSVAASPDTEAGPAFIGLIAGTVLLLVMLDRGGERLGR